MRTLGKVDDWDARQKGSKESEGNCRDLLLRKAAQILGLALLYALAGKVGLKLAFINASATAIWPPSGIALAALVLLGYRVWPGILIGAFIVNTWTTGNLPTSLMIAAGNTLEGLVAAWLLNRFAQGREAFELPSHTAKFAVFAAMGSPILAACFGVTSLALAGLAPWADFGPVWLTWWLGDASSILLTTPLILLWVNARRIAWDARKSFETGLAIAAMVLVGMLVFGGLTPPELTRNPLEFLALPIILWVSFRLSARETATLSFVLALVAIWGTLHHSGPFAQATPNTSLLLLQSYLSVVALTGLIVSSVIAQRRRFLRASEARFSRLMESNIIGLFSTDEEGRIVEANDAFLALLGYNRSLMKKGELRLSSLTPVAYQAQDAWTSEQLRKFGHCEPIEKEYMHKSGERIPVLVGSVLLERAPARAVSFVIDATSRRRAMNALRQAYDEIETRVEQRTAELSQANFELAKEIARRKQAEAELRDLSLLDPLTGLYNRRGFLALSEQQWLQAHRDGRELLLFFIDVDGLKAINDGLGHARGDQALVEAAEALRATFRKSDVLARIGGDEFAAVAGQAPLDRASVYMERLQTHLAEVNAAGRLPFKISLSMGVARFDRTEGETSLQELMRRADDDLYARRRQKSFQPTD